MKNCILNILKIIVSCVVIWLLVIWLVGELNGIVIDKANNRYYILEDCIKEADADYDVQIYGSCHAYTSFDPVYFGERYAVSSYVFANPGEIIPTTYLRMLERFKVDAPKVAVIDIWGLNAYETYSTYDRIFNLYMPVNVELLPLSVEKIKVIRDFESLDLLADNFPIAKYKDRLLNMELRQVDFAYSFADNLEQSDTYKKEMTLRRKNGGFAAYTSVRNLADYDEKQAKVADADKLAFEEEMMKYVDKIVDLCSRYGVKLIFYRAPYISTENELRKVNWFADYCVEKEILFVDTEKEVAFDHSVDFMDYYHLNATGARRVTEHLAPYILEKMR